MDKERIYKLFIAWFVTPIRTRKPESVEDFIVKHKILPSDIAEFTSRDSFTEDVVEESIKWGKSKFPELIQSTYEAYMEKKNPQMLLGYQKLLEFNKDNKGPNINFNLLQISDDRYQQILRRSQSGILDIPATTD